MTLSEKISFLWHMSWEHRFWLVCFFLGSLFCRLAVHIFPSRYLAKNMGDQYLQNRQLSVLVDEGQALTASRMGKLMRSVSKNIPWASECLTEALCVKWMLNRYRIPAVFYLGAHLSEGSETMKAHAWLTVGPYVVTGAPAHLDYRVTATFVSAVVEY